MCVSEFVVFTPTFKTSIVCFKMETSRNISWLRGSCFPPLYFSCFIGGSDTETTETRQSVNHITKEWQKLLLNGAWKPKRGDKESPAGCLPIFLTFEKRWFLKWRSCIIQLPLGCGALSFSSFLVSCFNNESDVFSMWLLEAPLARGSWDDVTPISNSLLNLIKI